MRADGPEEETAPVPILPEGSEDLVPRWEQVRSYGFCIGPHRFLVPQGLYCELLSVFQIAPLPNAPAHVLGLIMVRGDLVPLYQLEPLLGLKSGKRPYALLVGPVTNGAAILIGDKPRQFDLARLESAERPAGLPGFLGPCLGDSYRDEGAVWSTIQHEQLFKYLAGVQAEPANKLRSV